ncbi:MAG: hypothetical protein LBM73_03475 [Candidatus Nomurabacteria bacterium]|jgi:hypothetical protein|nr:hypothetical protein [Candidatus Nomurabacteria bacterium]
MKSLGSYPKCPDCPFESDGDQCPAAMGYLDLGRNPLSFETPESSKKSLSRMRAVSDMTEKCPNQSKLGQCAVSLNGGREIEFPGVAKTNPLMQLVVSNFAAPNIDNMFKIIGL